MPPIPAPMFSFSFLDCYTSSFCRARSIYERALDTDHRNVVIWLKYAEMEMRHRAVNHARNIFDRATVLLPRVDQFWYGAHASLRASELCLRLLVCAGTNMCTWRRCWGMLQRAGRRLRGGWSGSRMSRVGCRISSLSYAITRWSGHGRYTSALSLCIRRRRTGSDSQSLKAGTASTVCAPLDICEGREIDAVPFSGWSRACAQRV